MSDAIARSLSDPQVRGAKPRDKPYKLTDGGGLFLLVQTNGARLWRYKFRLNGKEGLHALGAYPEVSLSAAREAHRAARALVAAGTSPVQARQAERVEAAQTELLSKVGAFPNVVDAWRKKTDVGLAEGTKKQRTREVRDHLIPAFRARRIDTITRMEIAALLRRVEAKTPETARNLRSHLDSLFEYAIDEGLVNANPVPPTRSMKTRQGRHIKAMAEDRIPAFLTMLETCNCTMETRTCFWLVMMSCGRRIEGAGARWDEFDLDAGDWDIPAIRMKARRPHYVPLPRQVVQMLRRLEQFRGDSPYVFPNRFDKDRPMTAAALNELLRTRGFKGETVHGFRSIFSTRYNGLGRNPDVIERCLAHVERNQVRAAYNRFEYKEQRRELLQEWADYLFSLAGLQESLPNIAA